MSSPAMLSVCLLSLACLLLTGAECQAQAAASVPAVVSVFPQSVPVVTGQAQQFQAEFSDPSDKVSGWKVNGVAGGNSTVGTVSSTGLYKAPAHVFSGGVTVTAASAVHSSTSGSASIVLVSGTPGHAYFVAKTGKDSDPGSSASPWLTIQHAANTVQPGDTVSIHTGVYNEQVHFTRSGSATGGFITFQSYPGETATVDGTGLSPQGQSGLIDIEDRSFLIVRGLEIRNFKTSSAAQVPIGVFVSGSGTCIEILNNHIHAITTSVKNDSGNALGFAAYGSSGTAPLSNLILIGNEVDHLVTGSSESMTVNGNVQYFQILHNLVHDNNNIGIDAIGFEQVSSSATVDQARDGQIIGNEIYNISSATNPAYTDLSADALYVDGGARIIIEDNLVHNADIGLELASEHAGDTTSHVTARNNIVYNCNIVGVTIGGYDAKRGGTDSCTLVNNTLYNNDTRQTGSGEFQIQYYATNNLFENNILYANSQGLFLNGFVKSSVRPSLVDHNLYYSSAASADEQWTWQGKTYTGFAKYVAQTGNDPSGLRSNPRLVSLTRPDFHLTSASPALDIGALLGSLSLGATDFDGVARVQGNGVDLGALEY